MTIVSLPYHYRVKGVATGHKSARTHHVLDTIMVDVPDLSKAETPVAVEIPHRLKRHRVLHRSLHGRPVEPMQQPGHGEFGWTDGRMTAPVLQRWTAAVLAREPNLSWQSYPLPLLREYRGLLLPNVLDDAGFRRVDTSHHDEDRAAALDIASRMVFVDGELHAPAQELRYAVQFDDRRGHRLAKITSTVANDAVGEVFRYDRHDDMMRFVDATTTDAHARGVDLAEAVVHGGIDWQHDDASESALNAAQGIMLALRSEHSALVSLMDASFLVAMAEVRDLQRMGARRNALVPALRSMADALENCEEESAAPLVRQIGNLLRRPLVRQNEFEAPTLDANALHDLAGFSRGA